MLFRVALVALVFAAIGAGVAVGVMVWEPWGGNDRATTFSMTLHTDEDFDRVARRMADFMPDFDCSGQWAKEEGKGTLRCSAGLTGFTCELIAEGHFRVVECAEGEQPAGDFPYCGVSGPSRLRRVISCYGPDSQVLCEIQGGRTDRFLVTCQRT